MRKGDFFEKAKKKAKDLKEEAKTYDYVGLVYDFMHAFSNTTQPKGSSQQGTGRSGCDFTGFAGFRPEQTQQRGEKKMRYYCENFSGFGTAGAKKRLQQFFDAHPNIVVDGIASPFENNLIIVYHFE